MGLYSWVFPMQTARAVDSISNASDTISDSDTGVTATHSFVFVTGTTTPATGYWEVIFPAGFTGIVVGNVTCGAGTAGVSGQTVTCTMASDQSAGTSTITVSGVTNPSTEGTQYITINNRNGSDVILERVKVAVAIVEDVLMTARVDSSLTFTVNGTSSGAVINGVTCDNDTTATTTDFGTLAVGTPTTVCQTLEVTTNADDGYIVTVQQDQELTSDSGSNINSFDNSPDGTGSTTPHTWVSPTNTLDAYHTYGHMGLTSSDADLSSYGYSDFTGSKYAGLNSTDTMVIMHHNGPSDGSTQNKGFAGVAYTAEIGSLQEAGDYENTLTYICTPTF